MLLSNLVSNYISSAAIIDFPFCFCCNHCLHSSAFAAFIACIHLPLLHSLLAFICLCCIHCLHSSAFVAIIACIHLLLLHSLLAFIYLCCIHCLHSSAFAAIIAWIHLLLLHSQPTVRLSAAIMAYILYASVFFASAAIMAFFIYVCCNHALL